MDRAFSAIEWLVREYRSVAMAGLIFVFAFPFVTTGILWMDRTGYFPNVYQVEHAQLRELVKRQYQVAEETLRTHHELQRELIVNRGLISNGAYYQQRTCVNTAKNNEERERCIK